MPKTLEKMTDAELAAEADRLAEVRTATRLAQNAVAAELEIRRALAALSEPARRIVRIRLEGGIAPIGEWKET